MTRKLLLIKSRDAQAVLRWMTGEPTDGQKKAGNYRKPTTLWNGLKLKIENPTGSVRRHADGQTRMLCPYGYIAGSCGADGDEIDVFIGPMLHDAPFVFVVQQRVAGDWKVYDEDKVMLGFMSELDARRAYRLHYDDDRFLGPVVALPVPEFLRRLKQDSDRPDGSIADF
jgi:hypothetical protein